MLSSLFTITHQGCRTTSSASRNGIKAATTRTQQIQCNNHIIRSSRYMSATAKVWIDKNTRVICQGFTGKQVRTFLGAMSSMSLCTRTQR